MSLSIYEFSWSTVVPSALHPQHPRTRMNRLIVSAALLNSASRKLWECKMCYVFVDYVVQINAEADAYMSVCFCSDSVRQLSDIFNNFSILWVLWIKIVFWRANKKKEPILIQLNVFHDLAGLYCHIFLELYLSNKKFHWTWLTLPLLLSVSYMNMRRLPGISMLFYRLFCWARSMKVISVLISLLYHASFQADRITHSHLGTELEFKLHSQPLL